MSTLLSKSTLIPDELKINHFLSIIVPKSKSECSWLFLRLVPQLHNLEDNIIVFTDLEIRTFIAMSILPLTGAASNGTFGSASPLFAS